MRRICPKCYNPLTGRRCACGFQAAPNSDYAMALPNYVLLSGRYILLHVIGAGGFGVTYKALDMKDRCIRAIKEFVPVGVARRIENGSLVPDGSAKVEIYRHAMQRFLEEAYILQQLNALDTTATITDCFEENGTAYFVMEFVDGATIKQELRQRGRIPLPEALNILGRVAVALEHIHTKANIFHRDISPENIMLCRDGSIKLLDFGSAKLVSRQVSQHFTVVLKAGYAPPEQYSSASPQGPYTDVYALASTFYYMVAGTKIPDAPARINGAAYRPLKMIAEVPADLSDAVDRALRLSRRERTGSCARFWLEIQNSVQMVPVKGEPVRAAAVRPEENRLQRQAASEGKRRIAGQSDGAEAYAVIAVDGKRHAVRLNANIVYNVGRNHSNDIVLPANQRISNLHFYLYFDPRNNQFSVKDVSTNGVFINGRNLEKHKYVGVAPGTVLVVADNACQIKLCLG